MKKVSTFIILFYFTCMFSSGQTEQMIVPGDLKQQTIVSEPVTLRKGYLRSGIEAAFIIVDKMFDENGKRNYNQNTNFSGKRHGFILSTQYGLTDKFELSLRIPYLTQQYLFSSRIEDVYHYSDTLISFKSKGNGISDLEAGARFQIIEETSTRPSMTAGFNVTLPTGRKNPSNIKNALEYDYPAGDGRVASGINFDLRKTVYPYSLRLRSYYEYYFKGKKIFYPGESKTEFKDGDMFQIRGNFSIHLNDWIALWNEVSYTRYAKGTIYYETKVITPGKWSLDYNPALYFQIRRIRFLQGVFIPIFGKNIPADPAYAFGLQYTF